MAKKANRYKEMERNITLVLLADLLLFILYLIVSANGIIWLKVILFILTITLSVLCLLFLYYTGEFNKQRSLWISVTFLAITICVLVSLILNYPSPSPYKQANQTKSNISTTESL